MAGRSRQLRAAVVYKRTTLAAMGGTRSAAWRALPPDVRCTLREGDAEHHSTLKEVLAVLRDAGIHVWARYRGDVQRRLQTDLVVTVGGDGTLLLAAGLVRSEPVLAVNSDPRHSVGVFAGATRRTVRDRINRWLAGRLAGTTLPRMGVRVNGKLIRWPVLNEVLLASRNPAEMTRYRIRVNRREEDHRCSGLYVATGPGSTGAIRSAGGRILPLRSKRLQFLARELYAGLGRRARLARGVVSAAGLEAIAISRGNTLFCDGSRRQVSVTPGAVVHFSLDAPPLNLLALDPTRRRRPWRKDQKR